MRDEFHDRTPEYLDRPPSKAERLAALREYWRTLDKGGLIVGLVIALLFGGDGCAHPTTSVAVPGGSGHGAVMTVTHVVDGDTIDVDDGRGTERVRLLGMDTPETVKPNTPVQCYGPQASARTKALLPPGTKVIVQRDAEARDRYGRMLLYVWRQRDGLFVNRSLITDGYARILSIEPNTAHRNEFAALATKARDARVGLWRACGIGTGITTPRTTSNGSTTAGGRATGGTTGP